MASGAISSCSGDATAAAADAMAAMAMGTVVYVFQWLVGQFGFSGMINWLDGFGCWPQPSRLSLWSEVMMLALFGDGVDVATTVLTTSATYVW